MSDWHSATVAVIHNGITSDEFRSDINASDIAWRLIGLVCGLDGLTQFTELGFSEAEILRHLAAMMKSELLKTLNRFHLGRYLTRRVFPDRTGYNDYLISQIPNVIGVAAKQHGMIPDELI